MLAVEEEDHIQDLIQVLEVLAVAAQVVVLVLPFLELTLPEVVVVVALQVVMVPTVVPVS